MYHYSITTKPKFNYTANAANTGGVLAQFFAAFIFLAKNATALAVRVICLDTH